MDEQFIKTVMDSLGYTREQAEGLSEKQQKIIKGGPARRAYKVVMEVVKAETPGCKAKVGDRIVMKGSGVLIPEECTCPLCIWAIAPVLPIHYVIYERLTLGMDPNDILYDHYKCRGLGLECGGIGELVFKVHCVKA